MKRNKPRLKTTLIFAAFLVCAAILGVSMLQRYEVGPPKAPVTPVPQEAGVVSITLFFSAADGSGLVREGRNIEACGSTAECIGSVVEELAGGPLGDLEPTIPPNTVVSDVQVRNGQAEIDLEQGFVEGLPSGSSAEMTAVYSIVDSVAVNFPAIKAVKLLVGGKPVKTGHLDLREPLTPDFTLEKQGK